MIDILIEMRREIVNSILFVGLVYCVNYFIKNLSYEVQCSNECQLENVDECQLENVIGKINDIGINDIGINDIVLNELQNKKEYLMELNDKLEHIKNMLHEIKNNLSGN